MFLQRYLLIISGRITMYFAIMLLLFPFFVLFDVLGRQK
nr:MAG TPA: hypothetical protein [Caudoviricetes sp.]